MPRVRIIADPTDLASYEEHQAADLLTVLRGQLPSWPPTARLYRAAVAVENDVTPQTEDDVAALRAADPEELFYVVVYPGDPITAIITIVVTLVLTAVMLLFLTPKIPKGQTSEQSSNNSLGQRVNKARPNGRIEDIYGEVVSVPALLTVPLLVFDDNLEVEYCFMCVGRGSYDISDVKDGDTPIGQIAGAGVRFYGPGTSPNSGAPFLSSGAAIDLPLLNVLKSNEVNGQTLRPPNANSVHGSSDIRFVAPDTIERTGTTIDFTQFFAAGDDLTVANADFGGTVTLYNATTQSARFYSDYRIEFDTFDPTTLYNAGDTITLNNAGFAGSDGSGNVVYVDVSGTYVIDTVDSATKTIQLVTP